MLFSLIIQAFKLSLIFGFAVVFLLAILNILNLIVSNLFAIPVLLFIGIATVIHKVYLKLTLQDSKYKEYYGKC